MIVEEDLEVDLEIVRAPLTDAEETTEIVAVVVFLVVIPREVVMKADAQDEIAAKAHGNKAADRPPRTLETTKNLKKRKTSKL
mmetsp:Transcript_9152/g.9903  ORF Transcript_9152/g.9903 Transcript_9152/m.9903 type:complete len:83 (+) Transcript_9152:629-877(+)